MKKCFLIPLLLCLANLWSVAQHSDMLKSKQRLLAYEDSLRNISFQVINNPSETERYNNNYKFIKTLVNALKTPGSFNHNFDSLKTVSLLSSDDRRFKIFTWHVMNNDGSYRYYGTIQMNNPGKLIMYPLVDHTSEINNPTDTVTTSEKWFGAQYYKIIPVTYNVRIPYYILLGWKGNTTKSTKKVIDVLYFKDGKAHFGMPVFVIKNRKPLNAKRVIFEYSRQVSMMLNYIPKDGMIVFDHLAPPDPKMKGQYDMYGPDMSYDGYKLINGRWHLTEDLQLKNPPSDTDSDFNDPRNPTNKSKRKFTNY